MKVFKLFVLTLLLLSCSNAQSYKKIKVFLPNGSDIALLAKTGIAFEEGYFDKNEKSLTLFVSSDEYQKISASGLGSEVLIEDWKKFYAQQQALLKSSPNVSPSSVPDSYNVSGFGPGSMGGYYTLQEVYTRLDSMHKYFPGLITARDSIGRTVEKRAIYSVKITNAALSEEKKPELLYTALHHAREPEGMMTIMYFMYYLLENYNSDPAVKYLLDNRVLYFIPVVNPDGYVYNQTTAPNGGGMWRKNRRVNIDTTQPGVDLNRNYGPEKYWDSPNGGSSTNPAAETYRGTGPFSEPETETMRNFVAHHKIVSCLNYHTFSNDLIYPYGALNGETPDSLIFRDFAHDITSYNGYVYGTDMNTVGYSTRGNSDDFMYDGDPANGKIFAMTPEVGTSADGFWPLQSRILPLAQQNVMPNLYLAWSAGDYVNTVSLAASRDLFNAGDTAKVNYIIKNKGLRTARNLSLKLTSLNPEISVASPVISIDSLGARTTLTGGKPFTFTVSSKAASRMNVELLFEIYTGSVKMSTDTLRLKIGTPVFVFRDTANDPAANWVMTGTAKWQSTTEDFHSAPNAYTESKIGNYGDKANIVMTLKDYIKLPNIKELVLSFWTKYEIESEWDYGSVQISTKSDTNWVTLKGIYTHIGSTNQPKIQLYDGVMNKWVPEEMSLSAYAGKEVKFRFGLHSDEAVNKNGWLVDDIAVLYFPSAPSDISASRQSGLKNYALSQNFPNPFNPSTIINFTVQFAGNVELSVYDLLGRQRAVLVNEYRSAGSYNIEFDAARYGLTSGVYFYRINAGGYSATRKMTILK